MSEQWVSLHSYILKIKLLVNKTYQKRMADRLNGISLMADLNVLDKAFFHSLACDLQDRNGWPILQINIGKKGAYCWIIVKSSQFCFNCNKIQIPYVYTPPEALLPFFFQHSQ